MKKLFTTGTMFAILAALMIIMSLNATAAPLADVTSLNVNIGGSNLIDFRTTTPTYNITINSTDTLSITANVASGEDVTIDMTGDSSNWQRSGSASLTIAASKIAPGQDRDITISVGVDQTATKIYTIKVHARYDTADLGDSNPTVTVGNVPVTVVGHSRYAGQVTVSSNAVVIFSVPPSIITKNGTLKEIRNNNITLTNVGDSRVVEVILRSENGLDMPPIEYLVTRVAATSNNANLSSLTLTPNTGGSGTWNYTFNGSDIRNAYTYTLPSSSASSITVTPTVAESGATVTVNGTAVPSGNSRSITLSSSSITTITVVVTALNGTPRTYTINVTRSNMSSNNYLSALSARANSSSGTVQTLYPGFSSDILEYDVFVANSVSTIYISATREDSSSSVSIEGISGTSRGISLSTGNNTIDVQVVAANGSIKDYTIRVRRATSSAAKDSDLTDLVMRSGSSGTSTVSLSPSFKSSTTSYTAIVGDSISTCRFVTTLSSSGSNGARAIVAGYVNGYVAGSVSSPVSLSRGKNTITIRVMAADCTTYTDYKVDVYRGNGDSSLSALTLRDGSANNISFTPTFKSTTTTYQASVANTVTSIAIRPVVNDANATVKINSTTLSSGNWSSNIALNEGTNNIIIEVTAADGTKTNYTLQIVRQQKPQASQIKLTIGSNIAVVDGAQKTLDSKPLLYSYNKNSYTMVPVRFVSEQLGAKVDWSDATKTVTITMGNKVLTLKINEVKPAIGLDAPAILYTDPVLKAPRTMVPLRYVSEQLGAKVDWDNNAKTVTITR